MEAYTKTELFYNFYFWNSILFFIIIVDENDIQVGEIPFYSQQLTL